MAPAAIQMPEGLSKADREEALRIVGYGTAARLLTDPYPLGGYLGIELGLSIENLPTEDLSRLGDRRQSPQADTSYPRISIGKGLFNQVDVFFHFIPYNQKNELSLYGGFVRWSFFRSARIPTSLSMVAHISTSNISNKLTTRSFGTDLVAGLNVGQVSVFMSAGRIQATGNFLGGGSGITDGAGLLETESISNMHYAAGLIIHSGSDGMPFFVALQIDRYNVPMYSGRIGIRL